MAGEQFAQIEAQFRVDGLPGQGFGDDDTFEAGFQLGTLETERFADDPFDPAAMDRVSHFAADRDANSGRFGLDITGQQDKQTRSGSASLG